MVTGFKLHLIPLKLNVEIILSILRSRTFIIIQSQLGKLHLLYFRRYECNWFDDLIFLISCIQNPLNMIINTNNCQFYKYMAFNIAMRWHEFLCICMEKALLNFGNILKAMHFKHMDCNHKIYNIYVNMIVTN